MDDPNPLRYAAFLSALVSLSLALYAFRKRREVVAAPAFAQTMAAVTLWSAAYGMELASADLAAKILWAQVAYIGAVLLPPSWLACVRRYVGTPALSRRALALLMLAPIATLLLVFTNDSHHLFWAATTLETIAGRPVLTATYAAGAWANIAYSYALITVSTVLLLQKIARPPRLYRKQAAAVLLAIAAPWVSHITYILGYHPIPGLDLTSFAFTVTGICMAYALFRLGLFRVMPVAQGAIVARIRDGIVVVNSAGIVVHVNPAAEEMLAVEATRAVGRPAAEAFAGLGDFAARFLAEDGESQVPIGAGEEQRILDVRICGLGDGAGPEYGRLIVLRDITAAKRAELALLLARDEAVAAARSKADFLATMSHEIRTPMNGVIGTTEILLSTNLDRDQRDLAGTIRGSAESLLSIINSILDFSKIEAGKVELERIDFDLRRQIEEILDLFGPRARNQGLEILSSCDDAVPTLVRGDAGRLRQVLTNLISNALKFTARGSVSIRCEMVRRDDPRLWLRFTVADTGIGIGPQQQQRLFEPFVQADSSTTREYGGTGLGLAISKRLIELMGGEIGLASQVGVGSRFDIVVPLEPVTIQPQAAGAARPNLRGEAILLLDARSATLRSLEGHLKSWGAAVDTAEAVTQAVAILRSAARKGRPFGWLFVSLQAAGTEAARLLHTVRAESSLKHTRVVVMTEIGRGEDLEEFRRRNLLNAVLLKPLHESRLRECVASLLDGSADTAAAAPAKPPPAPMVKPVDPLSHLPPEAPISTTTAARILVVEDNVVNQKVAVRLLRNLGHAADVVDNGQKAVEAVGAGRYDLVFMDCHMPVLDGFAATVEIRRREAPGTHLAIVAMTANAMEGDREQCLGTGMDDYVSKPVRAADLTAMLVKWLPQASDPAAGDADASRSDSGALHSSV